jgi:hypothetical protein
MIAGPGVAEKCNVSVTHGKETLLHQMPLAFSEKNAGTEAGKERFSTGF